MPESAFSCAPGMELPQGRCPAGFAEVPGVVMFDAGATVPDAAELGAVMFMGFLIPFIAGTPARVITWGIRELRSIIR